MALLKDYIHEVETHLADGFSHLPWASLAVDTFCELVYSKLKRAEVFHGFINDATIRIKIEVYKIPKFTLFKITPDMRSLPVRVSK